MFKSVFGKSVILAAGLFFAVSVQVAQGQEVSEADIRGLPGYKSYSTLGSFTERLRQDPALFSALQGNKALAERIFGSTMAQRQVLSNIESSGDVQQALSDFEGDASSSFGSNFGSSFGSQSVNRQENPLTSTQKTDTSQRRRSSVSSFAGGGTVSSGGNLAAQRAIEKAQREREAATQRADDTMARAREIMNREQSAEALARQQEEIIASNEAVAAVMAELSDQPEVLQAFLSDGELLQKVMDKEVTLSQALAEVGADIKDDTASAGDAAVAENDSSFEDDSLFNDEFDGDPSTSEPEQGLVHVSGNHYKLGGMDVWDMNHIPDPSEQKLDANGWPKYLNVPAECPPPRDEVDYMHEARLNASGKHVLSGMKLRMNSYWDEQSWAYASLRVADVENGINAQEIAAPFIVPHTMNQITSGGSVALNQAGNAFVSSISYCPGDYTGVTPSHEPALKRNCSVPFIEQDNKERFGHKLLTGKIIAHIDYAGEKSEHCVVEPGKRYFYNFRTRADQKRIAEDILPESRRVLDGDGNFIELPVAGKNKTSGIHFDGFKANNHLPPYANACVQEGEMFPLNYPGDLGERHDTKMCGRVIAFSKGCEGRDVRTTCYDKTGQLPPVVYETQCIGGGLTFIKGYREKVFSNYACEKRTADGKLYTSYPSEQFARFKPVCAEHRDGEIRKEVVRTNRGYVVRNQYQCQYDKELNRYDWHLVNSEEKGFKRSGRYSARMVEPPNGAPTFAPVPHKETCAWNGEEYPLGTKMIQDTTKSGGLLHKRIGKHTYICMQRAPEPALPRFTHTEIKVSPEAPFMFFTPNGGEAYSVTFEAPPAGYEQVFDPQGPQSLSGEEAGEEDFSDKPKVDFSHNLPPDGGNCRTLDGIGHSHGWTGNLYSRNKTSCKSSCDAMAIASNNPAHHERVRCNNGQYEKCALINDQTDITCKNIRIQTGGGNRLELCPGPVPPAGCPTSGINPASYRTASNTFDTGVAGGTLSLTLRSQPVFANSAYASCSQMACRACLTTDNQAIPHGWSGALYPVNSVSCENCPGPRSCTCDDGVFKGACTSKRFGSNLEKWKYRHRFPQWQEEVIRKFYTSCNAQKSSCQWQPDGTIKGKANITLGMIGGGVNACQSGTEPGSMCSGRGGECAVFTPGSIDLNEDLAKYVCK